MNTRMFRYPCSYVIYTEAFDSMPLGGKRSVVPKTLGSVTDNKILGPEFSHLTAGDRKAILEILLGTKNGLPSYWFARLA